MRLVCPNCDSPYEVPDRLLQGRSRKLRCARCATVWDAGAAVQAERESSPDPQVIRSWRDGENQFDVERDLPRPVRRPPPPPPKRSGALLALAWIATLGVVAGVIAAFVLLPDEIVEAWPAAARLYALLDSAGR